MNEHPVRPRRPTGVTILALVVLIYAALNLARAWQVWQIWSVFSQRTLVSPVYPLVSGLIWGLVGLPLAWALWRGIPEARRYALPIFLAYSIYVWIDRLLLPGYPGRQGNWAFILAWNGIFLAWSYWVLNSAKGRAYFGGTHERRPEDRTGEPEPDSGSEPTPG